MKISIAGLIIAGIILILLFTVSYVTTNLTLLKVTMFIFVPYSIVLLKKIHDLTKESRYVKKQKFKDIK